jgi:hypothetical protein
VNVGLPEAADVAMLAIDPPSTLYTGLDNGGGVFKSTTGGAPWSPANTALPENASVLALAIDPTSPRILYTGTWWVATHKEDVAPAEMQKRVHAMFAGRA